MPIKAATTVKIPAPRQMKIIETDFRMIAKNNKINRVMQSAAGRKNNKATRSNPDGFDLSMPKIQLLLIYLIQPALVGDRVQRFILSLCNIPEALAFAFQQSFFSYHLVIVEHQAGDMRTA
jgi:hypothetical protein